MKIILKPRRAGKTTDAIKISAETWSYIVCADMKKCDEIFLQAEKLGLKIPFPLTFAEFLNNRYYGRNIKGFVIDNLDMMIQTMTCVPIKAVTLSQDEGEKSVSPVNPPQNKGLYQKYIIKKSDGSPIDSNADYFVLRLDTDQAAREAARNYSSRVLSENPKLAEELKTRCDKYSDC